MEELDPISQTSTSWASFLSTRYWFKRKPSPISVTPISYRLKNVSEQKLTCSSASSSTYSCARISTRVENCWPILMNVGPNRSNPSFTHLARTLRFSFFFSSVTPPDQCAHPNNLVRRFLQLVQIYVGLDCGLWASKFNDMGYLDAIFTLNLLATLDEKEVSLILDTEPRRVQSKSRAFF